MKYIFGLIVALGLVLPTSAFADNIGYIDMQFILANSSEAQDIQKTLQKKFEKYQKLLDENQEKIEKARKKNKSEKDIQKLLDELEEKRKKRQAELLENERAVRMKLLAKIRAYSESVAKEYGIDVVIDKQAVLYGGFNLTSFVLDKLDKS